MELINRTTLDTDRLAELLHRAVADWPHGKVRASVRNSRGADFSGTCFYRSGRIYVNLGPHVVYPYALQTHVARAQSNATHWWKEPYTIDVADGHQLALFVFLHEFYHWLVSQARRNPRRKESMCDRFATRGLVTWCGAVVRDEAGRSVKRDRWDFQDLDGFVAAARDRGRCRRATARPVSAARRDR